MALPSTRPARLRVAGLALAALVPLTSCSLMGGDDSSGSDSGPGGTTPQQVVLVTHESFALPKKLIKKFEQDSGYDLVIRASGDAGTLTNKLVLSQGNPTGDVAFGVDNTFASRALDADVFAPYDATLPVGAEAYDLPGDTEHRLTPIDNGNVCVNVDETWFADNGRTPPASLDDLIDPAYQDLFVLPGAASSSTGLAFLLATIAEYGDDWPAYWTRLMDNGAKLTAGWSDAYEVDFTQGGGSGDRPIVLSYDSSPAFTVADGTSTTRALLDTCFRQIEYAGVLTGADNPQGAEALIDFLLSPAVQAALPESMYVFPVDAETELPADWASYAVQPDAPLTLDPADIAEHRDEWLTTWSDVTSR
jgi:thiamine transport system substrate-binding protein